MLTEIEYCPARFRSSLCNRLLGGIFKSSTQAAESRYWSLRKVLLQISAGNRFALPVSYSSAVCRSANVLITDKSVNYHVTGFNHGNKCLALDRSTNNHGQNFRFARLNQRLTVIP